MTKYRSFVICHWSFVIGDAMSSPAAALEPKHACKMCGKPFDPEEGQEICDDCRARRTMLWIVCLVALLICVIAAPLLIQRFSNPRPP